MSNQVNNFINWMNINKKRTILVWIVILVVIFTIWLILPREFWQYLFFMRVPILVGLFLIALPIIAITFLRSMLKNLFVLRGKWQLTFVIIGAILAGMAIILTTNTILVNAPARFGLPYQFKIPEWAQYILAIALGLPICITATRLSLEERELNEEETWKSIIQGGGISAILLCLVSATRHWLASHVFLSPIAIDLIEFFAKHRTNGYLVQSGSVIKLAPGHLTTITFGLIQLLVYIIIFFLFQPPKLPQPHQTNKPLRRGESPALLYLLIISAALDLILAGLSFYFDLFRIPVILFFLLIFAFSYWFFGVDHFYQLYPDSLINKSSCQKLCNFKDILDKRLEFQNTEKTLVIICASGGGIQAAGWTAQVLTGLQELLGELFTKSIGLVSSVSGGSVGAMYYLDRFDDQKGYPPQNELNNIFKSATADSLDATGWGLAYPDLWRLISMPWLAPRMLDRGIALERDWQQEMQDPNTLTTLATWRDKILQGQLPIPIFNATLVENGKRFLISPINFNEIQSNNITPSEDIIDDFNTLYGDYDIPVVSGARLSATFPYVSPICRNTQQENVKTNYHVADGGYFDNSGFVTILEWLNKWLAPEKDLNLKRVILLQINPFPQSPATDRVSGNSGWFMTTIGPLLTLFKVRDPILVQRNADEVEILKKRWESENVEIDYYPIFFPVLTEEMFEGSQTSNKMQKIPFFNEQERYEPPLSWKLTQREKQAIQKAWKIITDPSPIKDDDPNKDIKEIIKALKEKWEEVEKEQQWPK